MNNMFLEEEQKLLKNFLFNSYCKKINNNYIKIDKIFFIINDIDFINNEKQILKNLNLIINYIIQNKFFISHIYVEINDYIVYNKIFDILSQLKNIPQDTFINFGKIQIHLIITNPNILNNVNFSSINNSNIEFLFSIKILNLIDLNNLNILTDLHQEIIPIFDFNNIEQMSDIFLQYMNILQQYPTIFIKPFEFIYPNNFNKSINKKYENFLIQAWNYVNEFDNNTNILKNIFDIQDNIYDIFKINTNTILNNILYINLVNLSIPLNKELISEEFIGGFFKIINNKIQIIPNNTSMFIQIKTLQKKFLPKCLRCNYEPFCNQQNLKNQVQYNGEILLPIDGICQLQKIHINTLLELYKQSGIIYNL